MAAEEEPCLAGTMRAADSAAGDTVAGPVAVVLAGIGRNGSEAAQ